MSKRKAITERMKIQAILSHYDLRCRVCSCRMGPFDMIEWDHITALALGGEHHFGNLIPTHKLCHRAKTIGLRATTAGSDIGKISKEKRIIRTSKFVVRKAERVCKTCGSPHCPTVRPERPKRKWPSRPFQSRHLARKTQGVLK